MKGGLGLVEELYEGADSSVVVVDLLLADTGILEVDGDLGVEEGLIPEPVLQGVEIEDDGLEHGLVRQEGDGGTGLLRLADDLDGSVGHSVLVALPVDLSIPLDGGDEPLGECVHHGHSDSVQTSGDLVGVLVELTSGVQVGQTEFHGGFGLSLGDSGGDTPTVVDDGDGTVAVDGDLDPGGESRHDLIDGVVHDLVDEVVQTAGIRAPDVHTGPLADRFETFEGFDAVRIVDLRFPEIFFASHNFPSEKLLPEGMQLSYITHTRARVQTHAPARDASARMKYRTTIL